MANIIPEVKKAVAYVRRYQIDDDPMVISADQEAAIRKYCSENGVEILKVFYDAFHPYSDEHQIEQEAVDFVMTYADALICCGTAAEPFGLSPHVREPDLYNKLRKMVLSPIRYAGKHIICPS